MNLKLIGMTLIVSAASWVGFGAAAGIRKSVRQLTQLKLCLELMRCEIECRLTPFRKLCTLLSASGRGEISRFFSILGTETDRGRSTSEAADAAFREIKTLQLPLAVRERLRELLASFGSFDVNGQLRMIELTQAQVEQALTALAAEKHSRCRCYRILGLCSGLALAILVA